MKTIPHTTDERYNKTLKHFEVSHNFFNAPLYNKDIEELVAELREELIDKKECIKLQAQIINHLSSTIRNIEDTLKKVKI